jgi:hypothetical protein
VAAQLVASRVVLSSTELVILCDVYNCVCDLCIYVLYCRGDTAPRVKPHFQFKVDLNLILCYEDRLSNSITKLGSS